MTTSTYTSKQSSPYSSMSLMHWVFFNPIVLISHSKCHAFICTVSSFLYITNSVEVKRKDWCVVTDQIENDCWMIPQRSVSIMFSVCHTRLCFFFLYLYLCLCLWSWWSLSTLAPGEGDDRKWTAGLRLRTVPGEVSRGDQECHPADPRGSPACHPWWVVWVSQNSIVTSA